jgi:hypothetical protein
VVLPDFLSTHKPHDKAAKEIAEFKELVNKLNKCAPLIAWQTILCSYLLDDCIPNQDRPPKNILAL